MQGIIEYLPSGRTSQKEGSLLSFQAECLESHPHLCFYCVERVEEEKAWY
jgi:hypothetical protein